MLGFLSGGTESASDGGGVWRERLRAWLQESLNHRVYDPAAETARLLTKEELRDLTQWRTTDLERYRKAMRILINHELDVMARQADYVVCYWEEAAPCGAAPAELAAAYRKGIPVYLVTQAALEEVSGWVVGCTTKVFPNFDELKSFLSATYGRDMKQRALWEAR